jgi:hypothetical protein
LQTAFYLVAFATAGIVLAIKLNWNNSREGFWLTATIVGIAEIPFILFVLGPGYVDLWPAYRGQRCGSWACFSPAWATR